MKRALDYWLLLFLLGGSLATAVRRAAATTLHPVISTAAILQGSASAEETHSHENLFDLVNFIILVAVLVYLLRKPLAQFFIQRSEDIRKGLEEGRKALEAAQAQLAEAEEKLRRLEQEIATLKKTAAEEMEAERQRMRRAGEQEAERIVQSAQQMIASATQAAKLELKSYAAREAIQLAEKMIRERLDEAGRARLVSRFIQGLERGRDFKPEA